MNAQVVEVGGKMLEAPGPLIFSSSVSTFVLLVTGGLEALRKGQMTVFLAGEKVRMFDKLIFKTDLSFALNIFFCICQKGLICSLWRTSTCLWWSRSTATSSTPARWAQLSFQRFANNNQMLISWWDIVDWGETAELCSFLTSRFYPSCSHLSLSLIINPLTRQNDNNVNIIWKFRQGVVQHADLCPQPGHGRGFHDRCGKNIKSFSLVSIQNLPGWETGLFSPQEKELGLTWGQCLIVSGQTSGANVPLWNHFDYFCTQCTFIKILSSFM